MHVLNCSDNSPKAVANELLSHKSEEKLLEMKVCVRSPCVASMLICGVQRGLPIASRC